MWGLNYILDSTELSAIKSSDTSWTWNYNTFCLGTFDDSLKAGNIDLSENLDSWKVYRKNITNEDSLYTFMGKTSDSSIQAVRDYIPTNTNTYKFMIIGETENYLSDAIYSEEIKADFFYWFLIYTITKYIFKFRLNVEEGKINVNSNVSITTNFSQYPVYSISNVKYKSGNPTALIGDLNSGGVYIDTIKNREFLIDFLNNNHQKLLKTPKGDAFIVNTNTNDYSVDNQTIEMEQTITFSWVETSNSKDVRLFDELIT